ncbi:MAG: IS66 family insertion sequence element accessory protein TnpB [Anaeromyxobacteraceae bacterium]
MRSCSRASSATRSAATSSSSSRGIASAPRSCTGDGTGLCVFAKRLEQGRFTAPWRTDGTAARLTTTELTLLLEGSEFAGKIALSPPVFELRTATAQVS